MLTVLNQRTDDIERIKEQRQRRLCELENEIIQLDNLLIHSKLRIFFKFDFISYVNF